MKINTMRRQWWAMSNKIDFLNFLDRKHEIKQGERVREKFTSELRSKTVRG